MFRFRLFSCLSVAALVAVIAPSIGRANPFPDANVAQGKAYHEELCVECHTRRFGGEEGSGAYLRENRRVKTPEALTQMLTACTTALKLELFPEDEYHIAGYLNQRFYRFGLK
ncbi:cytochrome c [Hydrogenophilus thiooxidans]|uniref:cytochrome c n=1 Tax=Hydrogenophilus thiooxidans TaxID=2820326 RepID=UPI001C246E87|nr:cytochrome c [Hydrogenophilus thiooxidans]